MSQKFLKNLLLLALICFFVSLQQKVYASHAMGADLTYTCLGNDQYEISLTFYRDCDGISAPTAPVIDIASATCGVTTSITLTQVGPGTEISPLCAAQINQSTCNGGSLQGVEQYTYTGVYTLPSMCTDWLISFGECCRNSAITNSDGPQNFDLFVSANIDNLTVSCNSSPSFTTPPVPYICAGQPFNYNHGAFDAEGDSLVYSLIAPADNFTATVPYVAGYSPTYPISTTPANQFNFDPLTGQMSFTPDMVQIGIVTVLVQEYRNGVLIGYTVRDMQVVVISCNNNVPAVIPPLPSEVMGGSFDGSTFQVCAGNTLSFDIDATDLDAADILTVTSNIATSIPGAIVNTIGVNPVVVQFTWPTNFNDVGIYNFTITIRDGACPTEGLQILGYDILVPGVNIIAEDTTVCENTTQMIQLDALPLGGTGNGTYSWSPVTGLDNPNISDPVATVTGPTEYIVTYNDGVCVVQDTIRIIFSGILSAEPEVSNICPNESVQLMADYIFAEEPPPPGCGANLSGCNGPALSIVAGTDVTATGPATTSNEAGSPFLGYYEDGRVQYLFRATELQALGMSSGLITDLALDVTAVNSNIPYSNFTISLGCVEDTTLNVIFLPNTLPVYTGTVTPVVGTNNFTFTTPYEWDGLSNIVVEICFDNTNYSSFDHVSYTATPFNSVVYQRVDNSVGCTLGGPVTPTDRRANITFNTCPAQPLFQNIAYTWAPSTGLNNPNIANPVATPAVSTTYIVTAVTDECTFMDTIQVNVQPLAISATGQVFGCGGSLGNLNVTVSTGTAPYTYMWSGGLPNIPNPMNVPTGNYTVTVTDATGCTNTAMVALGTTPPLVISVSNDTLLCNGDSDGEITLGISGGTAPYTFNWSNGATSQNISGLVAGTYTVTVLDDSGCVESATGVVSEPMPMTISTTTMDPTCNQMDGSITVTAGGGAPSYMYSNDGGTTFQASNTFPGLGAANYTIVVQDANGCTNTAVVMLNSSLVPTINSLTITDPDCMSANGQIVVNATGGTAPLMYSIGGGFQTSNTFSGLAPGSYTVTVEDDLGCQFTDMAVLTEQPGAEIDSVTPVDPSCMGTDGSITILASGGVAPIQYNIGMGFVANNVFNNLPQGAYLIIIQDGSGCMDTTSVTLTDGPGPMITNTSTTQPNCNASDGSIVITASGGSPALQYSNDGGTTFQPGGTFATLPQGNYSIVVMDANGCTDTALIALSDLNGPTVSTTFTDENCGQANGTITVTGGGGVPTYTYSNDNGVTFQATNVFMGLSAGTYDIVLQDANMCQVSTQVTITNLPGPTIDNVAVANTTCTQNNGSIVITASGGDMPYLYSIDGGSTTQATNTFNALMTGTYDVVVTDDNGCIATDQVTITDNPGPVVTSVTPVNETCGDSNGSFTVNTTGGTAPLTFSNGTTTQGSNVFTGLPAGTYPILVTDDNGCTATSSVTITNIPGATIDNIIGVNTTCSNANGSIEIIATGGTPTLDYSIDNGTTFQPANIFNNLTAGVYDVVVEDANGCQTTGTVTLTDDAGPVIANVGATNPSCGDPNGSIVINVTGGTPALQYSIDNGTTFQGSNTFNGLLGGSYNIVVIDANMCQATSFVALVDQAGPAIDSVNVVDPTCGLNNGSISVFTSGGTAPINYSIDNGTTFQTSSIFSGLAPGSYPVLVQDFNGCEQSFQAILATSSAPVINNVVVTHTTCNQNDGALEILASGGTPPLEYSINNGATFTSNNIFTNLAAGSYMIVVQDPIGCTATSMVLVNPSTSVMIDSLVPTHPSCGFDNGEITAFASSGLAPYQFSIDNGTSYQSSNQFTSLAPGLYNIVALDANGCTTTGSINMNPSTAVVISNVSGIDGTCGLQNGLIDITVTGGILNYQYSIDGGTTFQSASVFNGLSSGTYNIVVLDAVGCSDNAQVTLNNSTSPVIDLVNTTNPSSCGLFDGGLQVFASLGTPPIQYSINNGMNYQGANTFTGLGANTYNVVVIDAIGCTDTLIVVLSDPNAPVIDSVSTVDPSCGNDDGSVEIFVSGGNPNFEYSIDGGTVFQGSNTFEDLPAGSYVIIVEDFLGCQTTTVPITLINNGAPNIDNIFVTNTSCDLINGIIDINASGGTIPYQYSIDGGVTNQLPSTFAGVATGTYVVVVTDAEGCTATEQVVVANDGDVQLDNIITTDPSSCNTQDGSLIITASGGQAPYEFSINNGMTFQNSGLFVGLGANTYNVVVTDANGCTKTQIAVLNALTAPVIDNIITLEPSCGMDNGTIEIVASGGTPNYEYSIDGGATFQGSNIFNNLMAGTYSVVVEDFKGCTVIQVISINNPGAPTIDNIVDVNPACGNIDGTIEINVSGGTTPYSYSIDNGVNFQAGNLFTGLNSGVYDIIVVDDAGCETTDQVTLTNTGAVMANLITTTDPTCTDSNGDISIQVNGGTAPYQYSIDNGVTFQAGATFDNLPPGTYNVVVEDASGCQATDVVVLSTGGLPNLTVTAQDTNCGDVDGSIDIQVAGGTAPFQYSIDNGVTFVGGNLFENLDAGTYEVIVVDFNGCQSSETVVLNNSSTNPVDIIPSGTTDLCYGQEVALNAGSGYSTYEWSTGETDQIINATENGFYSVTATDSNGCATVDEIEVMVSAPIDLDVVQIQTVELGETVVVSVLFPDPNQTYVWTGSDGSTYTGPSFVFDATAQGQYSFTVTSTVGDCSNNAFVQFEVVDSSQWAMPNAFTPNDDGLNDTFGPLAGGSLRVVEFKVYNRWGEKIHDDPTTDWDGTFRGKRQPQDVYIYQVIVVNLEGIQESKNGDVHLLK